MNVLIVSESFIIRDSLVHLFNDIFKEVNISSISNVNDYNGDLCQINFIFIDVNVVNIDEVEGICNLKQISPELKIMVIDIRKNEELFLKLIKLSVDGYILDIHDKEEFIYIIKKILNGKKFYDSELLQYSMGKNMNSINNKLTNRELSVLKYVCKGLSNKNIAESMNITDYTIKKHVSSILSKLNLKNRQDIIIYARDNNIAN